MDLSSKLGLPQPAATQFTMLTSGWRHTCGIEKDTELVKCWGYNGNRQVTNTPAATKFLAISAGSAHTCGIEKDTRLAKCWGRNDGGSISPPSTTKFVAISCGEAHSCGIEKDTHLAKCWGSTKYTKSLTPPVATKGRYLFSIIEDNRYRL